MIVVGVDFSAGAATALRWAVREADRLGTTVLVVHAGHPVSDLVDRSELVAQQRAADRDRLDTFVESLAPGLIDRVGRELLEGPAARALLDASPGADLRVVGRRGFGAAEAALLGSVSHDVVRHARCPVAVVPESADVAGPVRRIVAGVDSDDTAAAATRWAVAAARRHGVPLVLCYAAPPPLAVYGGAAGLGPIPAYADPDEVGRALLDDVAAGVRAEAGDVDVVPRLFPAGAAGALLAEAGAEDVLVVGTHGHGTVVRLLLGSTSSACAERSIGATVVVPHPH